MHIQDGSTALHLHSAVIHIALCGTHRLPSSETSIVGCYGSTLFLRCMDVVIAASVAFCSYKRPKNHKLLLEASGTLEQISSVDSTRHTTDHVTSNIHPNSLDNSQANKRLGSYFYRSSDPEFARRTAMSTPKENSEQDSTIKPENPSPTSRTAASRPISSHQVTCVYPCLFLLSVGSILWCPLPRYFRDQPTEANLELQKKPVALDYEKYTVDLRPSEIRATPYTIWGSASNLRTGMNCLGHYPGTTRLEMVAFLASRASEGTILDHVVIRIRRSTKLRVTGEGSSDSEIFESVTDLSLAQFYLEAHDSADTIPSDWWVALEKQLFGYTMEDFLQVSARLYHQLGHAHLGVGFPYGPLPPESKIYLARDDVQSLPLEELQDQECPICLLDLSDADDTGRVAPCTRVLCSHVLHTRCVAEWIDSDGGHNTCPMCRHQLFLFLSERPYADLNSAELRQVYGVVGAKGGACAWSVTLSQIASKQYFSVETNGTGAVALLAKFVSGPDDPFQIVFDMLASNYLGKSGSLKVLSCDHTYSRSYRKLVHSIREITSIEPKSMKAPKEAFDAVINAVREDANTYASRYTQFRGTYFQRSHNEDHGEGIFPRNTLLAAKKEMFYKFVLEDLDDNIDNIVEDRMANDDTSMFPGDLYRRAGAIALLSFLEIDVADETLANILSDFKDVRGIIDLTMFTNLTPEQAFIIETAYQVQEARTVSDEKSREVAWDQHMWDQLSTTRANAPLKAVFRPPTSSLIHLKRRLEQADKRLQAGQHLPANEQLMLLYANSHQRLNPVVSGESLQHGINAETLSGTHMGLYRLHERSTLLNHPLDKLKKGLANGLTAKDDHEMTDAD